MRRIVGAAVIAGLVGAILTMTPGGAAPRLKPIKQLVAGAGLTGGGTGPTATVGLAGGGVTTAHVQNGSLLTEDLSPAARDALRGDAGSQGAQGIPGPAGPAGPQGEPGEGAITEGPGPGGSLSEFGRMGSPAPGGGVFRTGIIDPLQGAVNRRGQWLFRADIGSAPYSPEYSVALFIASPTGIVRVVGSGDPMPGGGALGDTSAVLLTDTGRVYFIGGIFGDGRGVYGWNAGQLFAVMVPGATTSDGKEIRVPSGLRLLTPDRIGFHAELWSGAAFFGETNLVYTAQ